LPKTTTHLSIATSQSIESPPNLLLCLHVNGPPLSFHDCTKAAVQFYGDSSDLRFPSDIGLPDQQPEAHQSTYSNKMPMQGLSSSPGTITNPALGSAVYSVHPSLPRGACSFSRHSPPNISFPECLTRTFHFRYFRPVSPTSTTMVRICCCISTLLFRMTYSHWLVLGYICTSCILPRINFSRRQMLGFAFILHLSHVRLSHFCCPVV